MAITKLVGQLEAMVQESGRPTDFGGRAWMPRWLNQPVPAFEGMRPGDFLDTMEGQALCLRHSRGSRAELMLEFRRLACRPGTYEADHFAVTGFSVTSAI